MLSIISDASSIKFMTIYCEKYKVGKRGDDHCEVPITLNVLAGRILKLADRCVGADIKLTEFAYDHTTNQRSRFRSRTGCGLPPSQPCLEGILSLVNRGLFHHRVGGIFQLAEWQLGSPYHVLPSFFTLSGRSPGWIK